MVMVSDPCGRMILGTSHAGGGGGGGGLGTRLLHYRIFDSILYWTYCTIGYWTL